MPDEFSLRAMSCRNPAREISDCLNVYPMKATILSILEQVYVIRFFPKDELVAKEIPRCLIQVHGEEVMKKMQVFYWVREIRGWGWCKQLSDEARLGRPCEINVDTMLAHMSESNPHMRA
jgi:hypothetical protein